MRMMRNVTSENVALTMRRAGSHDLSQINDAETLDGRKKLPSVRGDLPSKSVT